MPKTRRDELHDWAYATGFADTDVQAVLEQIRETPMPDGFRPKPALWIEKRAEETRARYWKAWPIIAYGIANSVAGKTWRGRSWQEFQTAYERAPVLMSQLLEALTRYHAPPSDTWTVQRVLPEVYHIIETLRSKDGNVRETPEGELPPWTAVVSQINESFPHLKTVSESQLKTESGRLKRRMASLRKLWAAHWDALRDRVSIDKFFDTLPSQNGYGDWERGAAFHVSKRGKIESPHKSQKPDNLRP